MAVDEGREVLESNRLQTVPGSGGAMSSTATHTARDGVAPTHIGRAEGALDAASSEDATAGGSGEHELSVQRQSSRSGVLVTSASRLVGIDGRAPQLTREELLEAGMSPAQANARMVRQHEEEIMTQHFARWVLCFGLMFFLVVSAATMLQTWIVVSYVDSSDADCAVPLRTWVCVLFVVWFFKIFRSCIDTFVCCWRRDPEVAERVPTRIVIKDFLLAMFDFIWAICMGLYWLVQDSSQDAVLPPCQTTAPTLYLACKVYVYFHIGSTLYFWINIIGLRNMLRSLMRNGYLHTNNGLSSEVIETAIEPVKMTDAIIEEDATCPICMEDYTTEEGAEAVVKIRACGHRFHDSCLRNWLNTARSCPCCRRDLGEVLEQKVSEA